MNAELQKCRSYYELLGNEAQQRKTAQHLFTAIKIAEKSLAEIGSLNQTLKHSLDERYDLDQENKRLLGRLNASITKLEGE